MQLTEAVIESILQQIQQALPKWQTLISQSFLSDDMKEKYLDCQYRNLCGFNLV